MPQTDSATPSPETDTTGALTPLRLVEAMLFVGRPDAQPLASQEIAAAMDDVQTAEIDNLVGRLNAEYASSGCPYTIVSDGAGYRMALRAEFGALRDRYFGRVRAARLSPAALEVLALVAYNEPLLSEDVARLRGTPSGHILSLLVRRQLLRADRTGVKPAKARYYTTRRFLDVFGLRSLDDLPRSEDLDRQ